MSEVLVLEEAQRQKSAETLAVRILGCRSQSLLTPKVSGLPRKARCGRSKAWPSWSEGVNWKVQGVIINMM